MLIERANIVDGEVNINLTIKHIYFFYREVLSLTKRMFEQNNIPLSYISKASLF